MFDKKSTGFGGKVGVWVGSVELSTYYNSYY